MLYSLTIGSLLSLLVLGVAVVQTPGTQEVPSSSLADSLFAARQYNDAVAIYQSDATHLMSQMDTAQALEAVAKAGQCFVKMRKADAAIKWMTPYLPVADGFDFLHENTELFYGTLSDAYYNRGDAYGALVFHSKVYRINQQRPDTSPEKMMDLTRVMGVLHHNAGQLPQAIQYHTAYAEAIRNIHGDHLLLSDAYNYLGMIYRHTGEYDMAMDYYSKAITNAERYTREERQAISPRFASVAPLYNNLGNVYHDLGDHEKSLALTEKAIAIRLTDKETDNPGMATLYNAMGSTYTELKRFQEAIQYRMMALAIHKKTYGEQHGVIASTLKSIGETYLEMGDLAEAEKYIQEALAMNRSVHGDYHPNTTEAFGAMARVSERKGNLEEALHWIHTAVLHSVTEFSSDNIYDNPPADALCAMRIRYLDKLTTKANLFYKLYEVTGREKDLEASYGTYRLAIEVSEMFRREVIDPRSRSYISKGMKALYEKTMFLSHVLYLQQKDDKYIEYAFDVVEKNKSRSLLESVLESQGKQTLDVPDSLLNLENGLKSQIANYERSILDEQVKGEQDTALVSQLQEDLFETRRDLENLKQQLKGKYAQYYSARYAEATMNVQTLRDHLSDNEMVIEYFAGNEKLYALSITKQAFNLTAMDTTTYGQLQELSRAVRDRDKTVYRERAEELYQQLVVRAMPDAVQETFERIIIIPDGAIAYVPFEILLTSSSVEEDYNHLPYAILKHSFNYWFSSALLLHDRDKGKTSRYRMLAGFAPAFAGNATAMRETPGNIPYAQQEVTDIAEAFPGKTYLGNEATESNFRSIAGQYTMVHLATHAVTDERNPNFSHLFFSGDETHDGMLHAYELFGMALQADLVTLSACNTGVGQWNEGEGAMSLSRAFAYAGCPSLVTSLWPAQDQSTAQIMKYFYANLSEGMRKDDALRQAKLAYLNESDKVKSDPFFWAGFVLVGDPQPLRSSFNWYYVWSALAVAAVIGFVVRKFRRWAAKH